MFGCLETILFLNDGSLWSGKRMKGNRDVLYWGVPAGGYYMNFQVLGMARLFPSINL